MRQDLNSKIDAITWKWFMESDSSVEELSDRISSFVIETYGPPF